MPKPLYLMWQDEYSQSGDLIIDEQHRAILATINSLHYFVQHSYGLKALLPTIKIVSQYIHFHTKTEEGILLENGYENVAKYSDKVKQDLIDYSEACREALTNQDPQHLLIFLKNWWIQHLEDHKKLSDFLTS